MLSTSARLLRLVDLLSSRRHWSGTELVDRLEIDARTVRRDVDRLRELGYPVRASSGPGGGYQLGGGSVMPPVALGDDEAVAMAFALRAAAGSIEGLADVMLALLAKLDRLLPVRLRARVSALESVVVSLPSRGAPPARAAVLMRVAAACRDRRRLHFAYRDRGGSDSRRTVEPMRLVLAHRRFYLVAWDPSRAAFRTFRMDRVRSLRLASARPFPARELPDDAAAMVARSLAEIPARYQLRVRLPGPLEHWIGVVPSWCGSLEAVSASHCHLHIRADSVEALAAHLLMAGTDRLEIEGAPPFLADLRKVAARLARFVGH
jgi:predicted DNA-binding transcriptional regulator YafY